jgi:hypothetical protein
MSAESVTVLGNASPIRHGKKWSELSEIFLKKHPGLREITTSPETALVLITITTCIHVTRFQSVSQWDVK